MKPSAEKTNKQEDNQLIPTSDDFRVICEKVTDQLRITGLMLAEHYWYVIITYGPIDIISMNHSDDQIKLPNLI